MSKVDHAAAERIAQALLDPRSQIVFSNDQVADDDLDALARAYLALLAHQRGCVVNWREWQESRAAHRPANDPESCPACAKEAALRFCADELENIP